MISLSSATDCESTCMVHFVSIVNLVPLIKDKNACIQFSFDEGLLHTRMRSNKRYTSLRLKDCTNKTYPLFACERGLKRITVSCTKGMWFENLKIPPAQILLLIYSFAHSFINRLLYNVRSVTVL